MPKATGEEVARRENAPDPNTPERDAAGQLTRAGMETVVKSGQSVGWRGKVISNVEELPTAAELTEGDPAAAAAELAIIRQRVESLKAQEARLAENVKVKPRMPEAPGVDLKAVEDERRQFQDKLAQAEKRAQEAEARLQKEMEAKKTR